MSSWRRAVQLGARFIRSTTKTNKGFAAVTGGQLLSSLWTVEIPQRTRPSIIVPIRHFIRPKQWTCSAGIPTCTRYYSTGITLIQHPQWLRTLVPLGPQLVSLRGFADLPAHSELTMPSLSPTMSQVRHACTLLSHFIW